jgi:sulfide:quinone oxidoreductase
LDPGLLPGLAAEPGNFYTVAGAEAVWKQLQTLDAGHVAVLVSRIPFKCPAAPYEAAMLIGGFLRKRRRRDRVEVSVWAAEPTPMGVAGPRVSQAVVDALGERRVAYHPDRVVSAVDAERRELHFEDGTKVGYDVLAYVPPHRVPSVAVEADLAPADGWVRVDPRSMETSFPNVFAIGDMTGIPLRLGKPLPKAGVFAHRQGEAVAKTVAHRLGGRATPENFDGQGECFIEMGGGVAGFARGNFYAEPTPEVNVYRPGRHWHAAKVAFERHWWAQWW